MDERLRVLALAEAGDWAAALPLVAADRALAQAQDDFGMLPLHWACTEPAVPLAAVRELLAAFPGACRIENLSGMLPLHVAVRNALPGLHVLALLDAWPEAAFTKDGAGRYPIDLAMERNLPKYTVDLIRKAGARVLRASHMRAASFDDAASACSSDSQGAALLDDVDGSSGSNASERLALVKAASLDSLRVSRRGAAYSHLLDHAAEPAQVSSSSTASSSSSAGDAPVLPAAPATALRGTAMDATTLSLQLKELLGQLQQLSADIRTSSSTSGSTYRSSFSSSSSSVGADLIAVLWNPSDKFGFVMEPADGKASGARIKQFASRSDVLGVEALSVGDVLVNINGASVAGTAFTSIMRFLKHSKVTCKLRFSHGPALAPAGSKWASVNPAADHDDASYSKVTAMLDATLKKVAAVEEAVRLSSAMSFCP